MQATRYVDYDGPVEIAVYTAHALRDNKGKDVDPEDVQWHWYVAAPNGIRRMGVDRGKTRALLEAEAAAGKTKAEYGACLAIERKETTHV